MSDEDKELRGVWDTVPINADTPTLELLRMYWECDRWLRDDSNNPPGMIAEDDEDREETRAIMEAANAELQRRIS